MRSGTICRSTRLDVNSTDKGDFAFQYSWQSDIASTGDITAEAIDRDRHPRESGERGIVDFVGNTSSIFCIRPLGRDVDILTELTPIVSGLRDY